MLPFVQTVRYQVEELQQGRHAAYLDAARQWWPGVEGVLRFHVLRARTGDRRFTEVITFESRERWQTLQQDETFEEQSEALLGQLGAAVDMASVEIALHDELVFVEEA